MPGSRPVCHLWDVDVTEESIEADEQRFSLSTLAWQSAINIQKRSLFFLSFFTFFLSGGKLSQFAFEVCRLQSLILLVN